MGHLADVFESQKLYEQTFKNHYQNADARAIILAYKVGQMITRVIARIREAAPEKYWSAIPKARNLAWALLVQAILNDKKYPRYREDFGGSLAKESSFGEILKQLSGNRVWPILKELLASSTYQPKVQQQKFEFLRTTEAYKKAMLIADERFEWTKQSF